MKATDKEIRSQRQLKADCEHCQKMRENGANFCGKCGKQLVENPVIRDYKSEA